MYPTDARTAYMHTRRFGCQPTEHDTQTGQIEVVKVQMRREPSLGMQLEEVARGGDGRGLVLVAGLEPGGNAEASGKVREETRGLSKASGISLSSGQTGCRGDVRLETKN